MSFSSMKKRMNESPLNPKYRRRNVFGIFYALVLRRKRTYDDTRRLHWICYEITNTVTGTKYIGKKQFYFRKTRQVKGKKKRYLAESDWIDYYGSSETFKQLVEDHGKDKFVRKILRLCKTKGELSYLSPKKYF
jgi:hypothetical protein